MRSICLPPPGRNACYGPLSELRNLSALVLSVHDEKSLRAVPRSGFVSGAGAGAPFHGNHGRR